MLRQTVVSYDCLVLTDRTIKEPLVLSTTPKLPFSQFQTFRQRRCYINSYIDNTPTFA